MATSALAEGLELTMLIGYLNESRDPYLDNYQSYLSSATRLSSHVSFVSIRCIFTETDHPPPLHFFMFSVCLFVCLFFSRTLDDPVLCRNCLILMTKPNTHSYVTASSLFLASTLSS